MGCNSGTHNRQCRCRAATFAKPQVQLKQWLKPGMFNNQVVARFG